jgi:hypothetical protein
MGATKHVAVLEIGWLLRCKHRYRVGRQLVARAENKRSA